MWNVYVILAIFERVMQVDLYPTAFLIPLLIPKEDEVAWKHGEELWQIVASGPPKKPFGLFQDGRAFS